MLLAAFPELEEGDDGDDGEDGEPGEDGDDGDEGDGGAVTAGHTCPPSVTGVPCPLGASVISGPLTSLIIVCVAPFTTTPAPISCCIN